MSYLQLVDPPGPATDGLHQDSSPRQELKTGCNFNGRGIEILDRPLGPGAHGGVDRGDQSDVGLPPVPFLSIIEVSWVLRLSLRRR